MVTRNGLVETPGVGFTITNGKFKMPYVKTGDSVLVIWVCQQ
ncbi:MAG: hypothetical protein ACR2JB_25690 [Bryobacteraceae bacterium]